MNRILYPKWKKNEHVRTYHASVSNAEFISHDFCHSKKSFTFLLSKKKTVHTVTQLSIFAITIQPARTPGDLHQKFAPPWGFGILAFAQEAGICWGKSREGGICL